MPPPAGEREVVRLARHGARCGHTHVVGFVLSVQRPRVPNLVPGRARGGHDVHRCRGYDVDEIASARRPSRQRIVQRQRRRWRHHADVVSVGVGRELARDRRGHATLCLFWRVAEPWAGERQHARGEENRAKRASQHGSRGASVAAAAGRDANVTAGRALLHSAHMLESRAGSILRVHGRDQRDAHADRQRRGRSPRARARAR